MRTIEEIEAMTEATAIDMAEESMVIKGYNVYFVDFGGYFGYSAVVFGDGQQIRYANDYELRHKGKEKEELREWYIKTLHNKLFTDEELDQPLQTYDEYTRKEYFLRNYYGMRREYVSVFRIFHTDEEVEEYKRQVAEMIQNPVALGYYKPEDQEFVDHQLELWSNLQARKNQMDTDYEYQKSAFLYEMKNHEYGINWQADWDVLSVFGNIRYCGEQSGELQNYFDQLGFTELKRRAYLDARRQYYKECGEL